MVLLRFNKSTSKWDTIEECNKQPNDLYLDGRMYEKLLFAKEQLRRNHDTGGLVVGSEGTGKSSLAGNIMRFMSNDTFEPLKQIIKDQEDAIRVLQECPRGSSLMFDESYLMFSSTEVMQKGQRDLVKIFSIIRQKNLFFLLVAPSFFRINSYFALDRTKFLVRVYTKKMQRGYFAWYGSRQKDFLYRMGKKEHNYAVAKPSFRGRFTKCELLENPEYQKIKEQTLFSAFEVAKEKKTLTPREIIRTKMKEYVLNAKGITNVDLARIMGCSIKTIERLKKELMVEDPNLKLIRTNNLYSLPQE